MSDIIVKKLNKQFDEQCIFDGFDHIFPENKVTAILGESGCGKTTLLRMICGLDLDYSGEILNIPKRISYVFQEDRLLKWMDVYDNIKFTAYENITDENIISLINAVGLTEHSHKFPEQLSGGMRRRVALCRAYVYPGELLLMDEPFKGLDSEMKVKIADTLFRLAHSQKKTTILVTHDKVIADMADYEIII